VKWSSRFLVCALSVIPAVRGGVIVNTSLTMTSLDISSGGAMAQILTGYPNVYATAFATAADTLGDSESLFDDNSISDPAMASALVTLAGASAIASGTLLTASSASGVDIPSLDAAVLPTSTEGQATLAGTFMFSDNTGLANPITVSLTATLNASQSLSTDASGISADSEVTYQLLLLATDANGNYLGNSPFLFYDNPLSIGSDQMAAAGSPNPLTATASLDTNTPYTFFLETDAESDGVDSSAPEPAPVFLVATGIAALLAGRRFSRA
jgi:hypothetical protein